MLVLLDWTTLLQTLQLGINRSLHGTNINDIKPACECLGELS
jgi:hypothetical protein